ncbi:MAG: hypothetical protein JWO38_8266 [Gemmataceae bacterium]|nr:hypothetical protein [Gemmataceae bacterium]
MHWSRVIGFTAAALISLLIISWHLATGQPPTGARPPIPKPPWVDANPEVPSPLPAGGTPKASEVDAIGRPAQSSAEQNLERQAQNLARQYARANDPADREKLRAVLGDVLQKLFDAQQKRRKDEVDRVEEHVKQLRDLIRKRDEAKTDIVRRRVDQLLLDADGLGWGHPDPQPLVPVTPAERRAVPQ